MIKFYNKAIQSFADFKGYNSLIFHSLEGCNLKCYKCHNYNELVICHHNNIWNNTDVLNCINRDGFLFDSIIFSGGEFLISPLSEIKTLLNNIKTIFNGLIIINSNGTFPQKIKNLLDEKLVDGIHLDYKLPLHSIENTNYCKEIYETILGKPYNEQMINDILKSVDIVIKNNSPYSIIRTVKYPILNKEYFEEIKNFIEYKNLEFNSSIKYELNDFLDLKE